MARNPRRVGAGAADHGAGLSRHARRHGCSRLGRATNPHQRQPAAVVLDRRPIRDHLMARTVHIVGAGVAGLAAAVRLVASADEGCGSRGHGLSRRALPLVFRSRHRHDHRQWQSSGVVGATIAVLGFAEAIGSAAGLVGPDDADFRFADRESGERWTLRINDGSAVVDFRSQSPGAENAAPRLSATRAAGADERRLRRSPMPSNAQARFTSGWCIRCCWRR